MKVKIDSFATIKHVDSGTLPQFEDVLWEWINVVDRCTRSWVWEDVPWWYNERASVGIFAGAVWRSGGIALEEFSSAKLWTASEGDAAEERYAGRCDLYFKLGKEEFSAEAKQLWPAAGKRAPNPVAEIQDSLTKALWEVRANRAEPGEQQLALVFASPIINVSFKNDLDDLIHKWTNAVQNVKCAASAWNFPGEVRSQCISRGRFYPGAALFIERAL